MSILPNWIEEQDEVIVIGRTDSYEATYVDKRNLKEVISELERYLSDADKQTLGARS